MYSANVSFVSEIVYHKKLCALRIHILSFFLPMVLVPSSLSFPWAPMVALSSRERRYLGLPSQMLVTFGDSDYPFAKSTAALLSTDAVSRISIGIGSSVDAASRISTGIGSPVDAGIASSHGKMLATVSAFQGTEAIIDAFEARDASFLDEWEKRFEQGNSTVHEDVPKQFAQERERYLERARALHRYRDILERACTESFGTDS